MKIIIQFVSLFCILNLVVSQIVYPAIRIHKIALLQNGNVTVVPFIERASPAPLVPRDPRGRRIVMAVTEAIPNLQNSNVTVTSPIAMASSAPLVPQDPSGTQMAEAK